MLTLSIYISQFISLSNFPKKPKFDSIHTQNIKKIIIKILGYFFGPLQNAGFIYAISDIPWVSPFHVVPKKSGFIVIRNERNELIPSRTVTRWRVCIDYKKLNNATRKDHFPLPFID